MFKNILLATDLSPMTRLAFGPTEEIVRKTGGTVHMFHAVRGYSDLLGFDAGEAFVSSLNDAEKQRANAAITLFADDLRQRGVKVDVHIGVGGTFGAIRQAIERVSADLVVIATRGRADYTSQYLGSTCARVLRDTAVPLLTVNDGTRARATKNGGIKKILLPTDFSEMAARGLRFGEEITKLFGAKLEVVHVVSNLWDLAVSLFADGLPDDVPRQVAAVKARVQHTLEKFIEPVKLADVTQTLIEDNNPESGILAYADAHDVDLIVMPYAGRDAVKHTILGSVTERIIKHARCPVINVKGL